MTRRPPAAWVDPWPDGDPLPGAPRAARWVAKLAAAVGDALDAGASLDDVAHRAGVSHATLRRLLDGSAWPRFDTADGIARAVACDDDR